MRPELQHAFREALALGPGHYPPDLFAGPVDSIVLGLKAHANTIAHARHVALEETFPRTLALLGPELFHDIANEHLADPATCCLPLVRIGEGFAGRLPDEARDLAAVELAWLEAHGAADALPFDLAAIAELTAQAVASTVVWRHPATRLIELSAPFSWDGETMCGDAAMITRPHATVMVTVADEATRSMISQLDWPRPMGELLEQDQVAVAVLVKAGAFAHLLEIPL